MENSNKKKSVKNVLKFTSVALAVSLVSSFCFTTLPGKAQADSNTQNSLIKKVNNVNLIDSRKEQYFDENVVMRLPETVAESEEISVIVTLSLPTLLDQYKQSGSTKDFAQYASTREAIVNSNEIVKQSNKLINLLSNEGVNFEVGQRYDTVLSGFEITIKASDFQKANSVLSGKATLVVGEQYNPCETEVVTNDVDVYETGIFDSSSSAYKGDGVVVAVLDTGLDYTHSAFSADPTSFSTTEEAFTLDSVSAKVSRTTASKFSSGLTGEDVYVSRKVPFAYDYADKDPDVLPINSEHGTHVAGVIAGSDDVITGVAPNAQLAIMKVFSDTSEGAKTSSLMAALEDCVILGVDVINMSLGTSCGFAREEDKQYVNTIYDSIREAGISLICAASNDYNATMGSEKNGNLGLTSNPDSGTVGSPSTYNASLSVASVGGVKTPYLKYGEEIIYFNESTDSSAKSRNFVEDVLRRAGVTTGSHTFDYVTIGNLGAMSDYYEDDSFYAGKIVLVKRGVTTFEEKIRIAMSKGAAGIIIYNNVSGDIKMSIGSNKDAAACSVSQDDGEKLAANKTGKLTISTTQLAGPFMSDFSSWGPTSDLQIKPEITSHGGDILSAVPGQNYDRLSGTSMAAPNMAGAATLIRQYVKYSGVFGDNLSTTEITKLVNLLAMSTSDIIYNRNGLPYAVRKQGAGLVNIGKATSTTTYVTTYSKDGSEMDKTKLELGDDKNKTGVYEMTFAINNVGSQPVTYKVGSIIQTEGVSKTYTGHSDTTVTQDGYALDAKTTVVSVDGVAVNSDGDSANKVTVAANSTTKVTVVVTLSDKDKEYLNKSFAHGMYVEGFITLDAEQGTNMNIPLLAFYGDWLEAPIFDEEYYDTNKDEINQGLDPEDKLMADTVPTKVVGGLYSDYITTLGEYSFKQNPSATQIAADKDKISLSNQVRKGNSGAYTACYIRDIVAGLLRNCKQVKISIAEDATGKEIFNKTVNNQYKAHNRGAAIYGSYIDVDFSVLDHDLKNNTLYNVTVSAYIDYGTHEEQDKANVRNTFQFPLYIDFEAPTITGVEYRTEYDRTSKKTSLYADISVYDNHYAMAMQIGQITPNDKTGEDEPLFMLNQFGKYAIPIYSSFNQTTKVTVELTDYVAQLKNSCGIGFDENGDVYQVLNNNTFLAIVHDYALNEAYYEITLPDEILSMYFENEEVKLSPNETLDLTTVLNVFPSTSWLQILDFESSDETVACVVNQTLIAKSSGTAVITAIGKNAKGEQVKATLNLKVLSEGEEGYVGSYSIPEVNKFKLTGYETIKAFYSTDPDEREVGFTGGTYEFGSSYNLSMYPSEAVELKYTLDTYFPERVTIDYKVGNNRIATIDEHGIIVAQAKGTTIATITVMFDGKSSIYRQQVAITVKDAYTINSIYLMSYRGLGGEVVIPDDRGITTIYSYAFSLYEYVDKDTTKGDVIDEEDPLYIKQQYLGENTITKIVIPEGVKEIQSYAFTALTGLEEVVLPSTLTKIGTYAFYGCTKLNKINLENVQFINKMAFANSAIENLSLKEGKLVAVGDYAFAETPLNYIELPESTQSIGIGAFSNCENLADIKMNAPKVKLGSDAFAKCINLSSININASVIPANAFANCNSLTSVTLGKDVSVIGEFAFANTNISRFNINPRNTYLTTDANGEAIYRDNNKELVLVAPKYLKTTFTTDAISIATGAFSANSRIREVTANNVTNVAPYAFANMSSLRKVSMSNVKEIGDYAFFYCQNLLETPSLSNVETIGEAAFVFTAITSVNIPNGVNLGTMAFAMNEKLASIVIGNDVTIGERCFYLPLNDYTYEGTGNIQVLSQAYTPYVYNVYDLDGNVVEQCNFYRYNISFGAFSSLSSLQIGNNAQIGNSAFEGHTSLQSVTLGSNATIGDYAFYNNVALKDVDLSKAKAVGAYAFSGSETRDFWLTDNGWNFAYEMVSVDGEIIPISYKYSTHTPLLTSVDLTSVETLGSAAFLGNSDLTTVLFGDKITSVADFAFAYCSSLVNVDLPANITNIGQGAFSNTAIYQINLTNIDVIDNEAFANTPVSQIEFKDGAVVNDGAFMDCGLLTQANIEVLSSIGAYAFAGTAIDEITLNAQTVGSFAFAESALTKVTFGEKLVSMGENPFYACAVETFGKENDVLFNGNVIGKEITATYDVSQTVKVIDGVLYQVVPNGLELVSYPALMDGSTYTVEEGTVRISDRAFAYSPITSVTLASTVKSIGDKAFYGCGNLKLVVFISYNAPILEEQYDESYVSFETMPYTGITMDNQGNLYQGLGITPYYMWNVSSHYNNFFYGANFVNYVGLVDSNLSMVAPANGQYYDSFILAQYFNTKVEGANAATDATKAVIELINSIPEYVTLECKELVEQARLAYDQIPSLEQKSLVSNYAVLQSAESTIKYLIDRDKPNEGDDHPEDPVITEKQPVLLIVIASVCAVLCVGEAVALFVVLRKRKSSDMQQ